MRGTKWTVDGGLPDPSCLRPLNELLEHAGHEWVSLNLGNGMRREKLSRKQTITLSWPRPPPNN